MIRPVYGLDPSLAATGLAGHAGAATITSKPCGPSIKARTARLNDICRQLARVEVGALVVIEGPGFSKGAEAGAHIRAGLWWRMVTVLDARGCELVEVSPTTLKKFATGRGNARKDDLRMAWYKRTGEDFTDDNQVDALWLRQVGLHLDNHPDAIPLPAAQLAALEKVQRP